MASLTYIRSRSTPSGADGNLDQEQTSARANQDRQFWVGGLPNDIWLCVLDQLCPHCHPGEALRLNAVFTEARKLQDRTQAPSRDALRAMALTCRLFRDLAQTYIGHRAVGLDIENPRFLRTMHARPDLAGGVREIIVTSDIDYRGVLELCTGIQSLNYIISTRSRDYYKSSGTHSDVPNIKIGYTTLVGKLDRLRKLYILPPNEFSVVDLTWGRLWLEALMKAAPELRTLTLKGFVDNRLKEYAQVVDPSPYFYLQPDRFPACAGLPENKITRLDLRNTWFRYYNLDQLLRNFKHLRDFRLTSTWRVGLKIAEDKTVYPVDGQDVVTLLEPLKDQLEVLDLDFEGHPYSGIDVGGFRPVTSLAGFTALKTLRLGRWSVEPMKFNRPAAYSIAEKTGQTLEELEKTFVNDSKDFLVEMLPCRSLEVLHIHGFRKEMMHPMCELARRKDLGEFPRLKHVKMLGDTRYDIPCHIREADFWQSG